MMTKLEWGCTPWDNLTRDELLREVERMYSALSSLYSIVNMEKGVSEEIKHEDNPYWSKHGSGGASWEKARQIMEPLRSKYEDEIYRAFFRYADDLLFEATDYDMIGHKWVVCDTCGVMFGSKDDQPYADIGQPCKAKNIGRPECNGTLRKLEWSDLRPVIKVENHE